ncbi:MAG: Nif3-like dinuclear metal center hexameric protein [Armatimonadota bacterium]
MTAREVTAWIEDREPETGSEEGFKFGDPGVAVTGVLVCWMATGAALEEAIAEGCNLVICHETLFYPQSAPIDGERCWRANRRRMELMHHGDMAVYRAHGKLDRLCIFEDFAAALGLKEVHAGEGYGRVFLVEPTRVGALAERAKQATGLPAIRLTGDPERLVTRVGLPWGGLGLFVNIGFMQTLVENGAEVGVCGETDEYAMRFAEDAGLSLIETSHALCENLGLRHFARMLGEAHPGMKVVFHESGPGWRMC